MDEKPKYTNVIIYDENEEITAKYKYYTEKNKLDVKFEERYDKDDLNYYYGNYTDENTNLKFNYRLKDESTDNALGIDTSYSSITSHYMKVQMYCENFHSNKWKARDKDEFEKFLEMIAEEVSREFSLYVVIVIDDGDGEFRRYGYGKVSDGSLVPYDDYKGRLEDLEVLD